MIGSRIIYDDEDKKNSASSLTHEISDFILLQVSNGLVSVNLRLRGVVTSGVEGRDVARIKVVSGTCILCVVVEPHALLLVPQHVVYSPLVLRGNALVVLGFLSAEKHENIVKRCYKLCLSDKLNFASGRKGIFMKIPGDILKIFKNASFISL